MILEGNNLETLKTLPDNSVDSVVTDPPYGLAFMGKKWDYDVPSVELWREVFRVLKPGGHVLSFGGTRTYHRMVVNIEDAGFEIRDQIMWIYGSGFPKSHNGVHGGTALKPANEPIVMARKPLIGTVATNFAQYGTGGLNIDASRILMTDEDRAAVQAKANKKDTTNNIISGFGNNTATHGDWSMSKGRWPANVLFDEEAAAVLDAQAEAVSRFFYVSKASKRERGEGNNHPTVKPIKLMEYLVRLVTPPGGVVLDPFMGSGTTGVACKNLGFNFIGCELSSEYVQIAKQRIGV